ELHKIEQSGYAAQVDELKAAHKQVFDEKQEQIHRLTAALDRDDEAVLSDVRNQLQQADARAKEIREDLVALMQKNDALADTNDNNYFFLTCVTENFPKG